MILKTFGAVLIPLWGFSTATSVLFRPLFDGEVNHDGIDSAETVPDHVPDPGLGRSASGLNCGNPSVGHNAALLAGLPDRTVIDFTEPGYDTGIDRYVTDPSDEGFRIVGGAEAVPHSWPWQVRVRTCSRWRCTYLCGGSLIAPRWAVTAAHCVPYRGDRGLITVGNHRLFDDGSQSGAKNYTISKIFNHEKWNKYRRINDITLILTANVIEFNNNVRPICMPQEDICFNPGTACVVTGWGYKNERGPIAKEMQEVAVRVIDHNTCKAAMWYGGQVYESQVCAGYIDGKQDSCAGDSGGPLVCRLGDNMPWVLYGVVSWGYGCARARKPGVYTKVPHFKDWIANIMSEASGGKAAVSGQVTGAQFSCATCKDHPMGTCGNNINPWFATQPAINTPQTEAATEPPTTTEAANRRTNNN